MLHVDRREECWRGGERQRVSIERSYEAIRNAGRQSVKVDLKGGSSGGNT